MMSIRRRKKRECEMKSHLSNSAAKKKSIRNTELPQMKNRMAKDGKALKRTVIVKIAITLIFVSVLSFFYPFTCFKFVPNQSAIEISHKPSYDIDSTDNEIKDMHQFLTKFVCHHPDGYCHPYLNPIPQRRTHNAKHSILPYTNVLILPRSLCISDLDAMRDETFIRPMNLLHARHHETNNPLDSGAYLAVHLIRQYQIMNETKTVNQSKMLPFFQILPTFSSFKQAHSPLSPQHQHPTLWPNKQLQSIFGKHTLSYQTIKAFRDMIASEYQSFSSQSKEFAKYITKKEYMSMRICVISRSFGTGPPGQEETNLNFSISSDDTMSCNYANCQQDRSNEENDKKTELNKELEYYQNVSGVQLQKGCRAMAPILDMWDHHANPNVEWKYDNQKRAFIVTSTQATISKGHDIMVSYGTYTDTHLFAKFGFVNSDGSGWTEASIATFHTLADVGLGHQYSYRKLSLKQYLPTFANYLAFDDGYMTCINPDSTKFDPNNKIGSSWNFKQLKLINLYQLSNHRMYWVLKLPPRNPNSNPMKSSNMPFTINANDIPKFHPNSIQSTLPKRIEKLLMTCRLISINEDDYDGNAFTILSNALQRLTENEPLQITRQSDYLEYRAMACLMRLSLIALSKYPFTITQNIALLQKSNENFNLSSSSFQSPGWYRSIIHLGEMQTLEVLRRYAMSGLEHLKESIWNTFEQNKSNFNSEDEYEKQRKELEERLKLRDHPCPPIDPTAWNNIL